MDTTPEKDERKDAERGGSFSYSPSSTNSDKGEVENTSPKPDQTQHRRNVSIGLPPLASRQRSDASTKASANSQRSRRRSGVVVTSNESKRYHIPLPFQPDRSTTQAVIELPDGHGLVNPLEAEAETYLIRSLENAVVGDEPPVLSNIPDDLIGRALSEEQSSLGGNQDQPPAARHRRLASTDSYATSTKTSAVPAGNHRRKQTLDQQLFGLADAIEAIHMENEFVQEPEFNNRRAGLTKGLKSTRRLSTMALNVEDPDAVPASSFDTFAQNAELMFQQGHGEHAATVRRRRAESNMEQTHMPSTISEVPDEIVEDEEQGGMDTMFDANSDGGKQGHSTTGQPGAPGKPIPKTAWARVKSLIFDDWALVGDVKNFIRPKRNTIHLVLQVAILYVSLPSLAVAAILFYFVGNPPTGRLINQGQLVNGTLINDNGNVVDPAATSISYYLLFAGVRQVVTLMMALASQLFFIDFLAIDRGYLFKFGARLPLFIMQAHGWPFVLFFWSMYDWALISGKHPFFSHWLHFQNAITLFNMSNPDGDLVASEWNHRILGLATGLSLAVAVKRFWMGIFLGKQTYYQFSDKLAVSMKKMLLISQIAMLSRQIESSQGRANLRPREVTVSVALTQEKIGGLMDSAEDDGSNANADDSVLNSLGAGTSVKDRAVIDPRDRSPLTGKLSSAQQSRIVRLLGAWEEPDELTQSNDPISINSLMHFRRAVSYLRTEFPFSASFGPAGTREDCITSAQEVFRRLMLLSELDDSLNFEVLALLGAKSDGTLDHDKLREMIKLFRPDRDGSLSQVHFVRSVDNVYKEIRLLRASVSNSSKVDAQFEVIVDIAFYLGVFVVALFILGIDPLSLFVSVSGLVVGLSFMISSASAKYFQGLVFILVRRPYAIGDCIHISDPNSETASTGSGFWVVEDITLFATIVRFSFTNERASLSNGALSDSRIINSSKSYNASVYHMLKFPIDVPYDKLSTFHEALEAFVRNRPREWIGLSAFRANSVNASEGFIEYLVAARHRESWASWGAIRSSQSDLMGFGVELAKKLDIIYRPPTLPIDLKLSSRQARNITRELDSHNFNDDEDREVGEMFGMPGMEYPTHEGLGVPDTVVNPPGQIDRNAGRDSLYTEEIQSLAAQFPPMRVKKNE